MSDSTTARRGYHHGDLRARLVHEGLELLAEAGVSGFSVAKVAARAHVSSAAPYRHFPDRESLLAACATVVVGRLADRMAEAADAAGDDPVERLAATAGAYARYVAEGRVGMELLFAPGFHEPRFRDLHEGTRKFFDTLLPLVVAASGSDEFAGAMDLLEAHVSLAHGYATVLIQGSYPTAGRRPEDLTAPATEAARNLITGERLRHAAPPAAL
ncbi:TetR/AcrR family transcriptional regulator [uncultured Streptomyces sp.]|uniref:TetR/AcrR family transcriptional regulator n=1 Tax=uncultured Streptomyces sp. TaxID=174707 RepID=UPI00262A42BE|nr:TetR/AcrR family transcriptional regulator [uncultured Streptomyces sp.]